jgi:SAM-dependent methyltransferase
MLPELVCPACRGRVTRVGDTSSCDSCARVYPIIAGIPDLRLRDDRYLSLEDDRRKAQRLASVPGSFADVLHAYWSMTPEVPATIAERYVVAAQDGPRRARRHLRQLRATRGTLLDVGCGTGGLLVAAAGAGYEPIGVDIALRWLVVAARALADRRLDIPLVAADGGSLPFPDDAFDVVTAVEVLEHAARQPAFLHGCLAATAAGGTTYLATANRYSVAPEPTVRLLGVGWLPRRYAARYVRARRDTGYDFVRPVSAAELRRMLGPRADVSVRAGVLPAPPADARWLRRRADSAYERIRRSRLGDLAMTRIGPYLEVRAH